MHPAFLVCRQLAHASAASVVDAERDISALGKRVAQEVGDHRAEWRIRR